MSKPGHDESSLSRRGFLIWSELALAASAKGSESARADATAQNSDVKNRSGLNDPVSLVNLLQGSDSTAVFSRGNTLPIPARPFGMARWTLQSQAGTPWLIC